MSYHVYGIKEVLFFWGGVSYYVYGIKQVLMLFFVFSGGGCLIMFMVYYTPKPYSIY